jgi:IrrE N-terminal-like domain
MRWYRGADGSQQIYIKDSALEDIVEAELAKARLTPTETAPVVDIEAFIERHLGATLDAGADLEPTVLGLTELRAGEAPSVLINRDLTDAAVEADAFSGTLGRWRATLAHEATHVLLHRSVFELNADQMPLFGDAPDQARLFRCLKREVVFSARGRDPREVQANKGMAALLMPRGLFGTLARARLRDRSERDLVDDLAQTFAVSRQATRIRLQTLGFLEPDGIYVLGLVP